MSGKEDLGFLLRSAQGRGSEKDRERWDALVELEGEVAALARLADWLASGPTWEDDPDDEDHPASSVLARAAEDAEMLMADSEVLGHLGRCDECLEAFDSALVERLVRDEADRASPRARLPWFGAAAALVLAFVGWQAWNHSQPEWSARMLASLKPVPVRILRSASSTDPFDAAYREGLEVYVAEEYAAAISELERAVEFAPDRAEARLYLGSALLLQGEAERACDVFAPGTLPKVQASLRDEILWQLAQAYLVRNDPASALEALGRRSRGATRHRAEAAELIEKLKAHP